MLEELFRLSQSFIRQYNKKYVRYFLKSTELTHRLSIIKGSRGIGKTTAVVQHILKEYDNNILTDKALYVQVDHFLVKNYSLYEIAETFLQYGGELLCLDEIHKYENWSGELKSIYDTFPTLQIIATGSSALEIHKGSHDLSRRAAIYTMRGMSFREFIEINHDIELPNIKLEKILSSHIEHSHNIYKFLEEHNLKVLPLFKRYLAIGYYPYFLDFKDDALFYRTLEQNIHTTIENDLLAIYPKLTGSSIKKLEQLLGVIASSVPFTPDMKKLKTIIGVGDERTLKNYLKYLEDSGLIALLPKSIKGLGSIEKPEKIYLHNPNLLFLFENNIGTLRETFLYNTLLQNHIVIAAQKGDFRVDNKWILEVGGKNKSFEQIKELKNGYVVADEIEHGFGQKIPLWLFGFMY